MTIKTNTIRVRILKKASSYFGDLGHIIRSNCDGTFCVEIYVEGFPEINLFPYEIEPC